MNIYKVERTDDVDFEEFESFVCYEESEEKAKNRIPSFDKFNDKEDRCSWATIENIKVELLGENNSVNEAKMIMSSFRAG